MIYKGVFPPIPNDQGCQCRVCWDARHKDHDRSDYMFFSRMFLCETCGNKRCPHATHHIHACTGSNEPGQAGSDYA